MVQANPGSNDDSMHSSGPDDDGISQMGVEQSRIPSSQGTLSVNGTDMEAQERILAGLDHYFKPDWPVSYFTKFWGRTPLVFAVTEQVGVQRVAAQENSVGWHSCQITDHSLFQVKSYSKDCRGLVLQENGTFTVVNYPRYPGQQRACPSVCFTRNKLAYLLGGKAGAERLGSCYRFDYQRSEWQEMPSLQVSRANSSSCVLGNYLYTFGGQG